MSNLRPVAKETAGRENCHSARQKRDGLTDVAFSHGETSGNDLQSHGESPGQILNQ